ALSGAQKGHSMIDLDAIRERDRGCSPGAIHRPSLYWAVQDRRALLAEADRLRAELGQPLAAERVRDELRAQVESLQSRWASRPLSHPDGEALAKENERLRLGYGGSKRAYYETHEPPHCPTCGCGRGEPQS